MEYLQKHVKWLSQALRSSQLQPFRSRECRLLISQLFHLFLQKVVVGLLKISFHLTAIMHEAVYVLGKGTQTLQRQFRMGSNINFYLLSLSFFIFNQFIHRIDDIDTLMQLKILWIHNHLSPIAMAMAFPVEGALPRRALRLGLSSGSDACRQPIFSN